MIRRALEATKDRLLASDPGYLRLRLAASAVLGIVIAASVLVLGTGFPLRVVLVGAIGAMMSAFTVNDRTPGRQAITLALGALVGACSLTAASLGAGLGPLDSIVFVLLIFVAVYAQRFGPRGIALGSMTFFLFFFSMFLGTQLSQVPSLIAALVVGLASNALVRFVLLRRRPERELLRIRRAFRSRLAAVLSAAATYLASEGTRGGNQLRRANSRLHECVLMIEDTADDVVDTEVAGVLRRRAIEVELAVQWLSLTTERTNGEALEPRTRHDLVAGLRRLRGLIERDPADLPLISETDEFSRMLVAGSRLGDQPAPGDELRRAIAELAVADVRAQRFAERDDHPAGAESTPDTESEEPEDEQERTRLFAYDNQTRNAIQALVGGGLAVLAGELVSPQRWYWAVLTVFVVFVGASSAGATFVKGARRLAGTLVGIVGGVLATLVVSDNRPATLVLVLLCVFGMVFTARVAQAVMAFFITTMLGLLYSLLGTFSYEVLWIRLAETAAGAVAGVLAAVVIVPVRTRSAMLDDIEDVLTTLREFLDDAATLMSGAENVDLIDKARDLDRTVEQVRKTVEPLVHPINISSTRRDYAWYVLTALESIGFRARHVAARAQPGLFAGEQALTARVGRVTGNVDTLLEVVRAPESLGGRTLTGAGDPPPGDEVSDARKRSVLSSLGQLDAALISLGRAFQLTTGDTPPASAAPARAQPIQPGVSGHTRAAGDGADSIPGTTTDSASRRSAQ